MRSITRHIPNALTLCNLLSGMAGLVLILEGNLRGGGIMIWIGAGFDFLDGFFARWLKAYSEVGKELDSLADMTTFGILPAFILFGILSTGSGHLQYVAFIIPVFSAIRLAKFNTDPGQKENFSGLPTPANAFMLSGLPFLADKGYFGFAANPLFITGVIIAGSLLMISPFRFLSLKFRNLNLRENWVRILIVLSSVVILVILKLSGITPAVIFYILISLADHFVSGSNLRSPDKL